MNLLVKRLVAVAGSALLLAVAALPPITKVNAQSCDSNAVTYCGATSKTDLINKINNGDGMHTSANLKQIYYNENRNITEAGINGAVDGVVTKDGNVVVNGQVVATHVWSSGREYMQNSVVDGSIWMRPPSVSFLQNSLDAWVGMDGGTFKFAILKTCGNPIKAINAPFGQIYKRVTNVTQDPSHNFAADTNDTAIAANNGDTLKYEITVTNNGTADMTNVHMTDTLPAGVTLVSNPSKRFAGDSEAAGVTLGTIAAGSLKTYTLTVKVDDGVAEGSYINNKACFTGDTGGQKGCDTAVVHTHKPGKGGNDVICTGLTKTQVGDTNSLTYKFTASKATTGAAVTGYLWDFGDGTSQETTTNTVEHTYKKAANLTATVRIRTAVGVEAQQTACKTSFEVKTSTCTEANNCQPTCTEQHNCVPTCTEAHNCAPTCTEANNCTKLPETGAEGAAAGMLGTGALGYSLRAYLRSKKSLLDALKR